MGRSPKGTAGVLARDFPGPERDAEEAANKKAREDAMDSMGTLEKRTSREATDEVPAA